MTFPISFSPMEQCQVQALLDEAEHAVQAYSGSYSAWWLLTPIHAPVWRISKGNETRTTDGQLINHYEFSWSIKFADGTDCTDEINKDFLHNIQKIAFLARELPGGPNTLTTHKLLIWSLKIFARWAYLQSDILDPRRSIFTKVKKEHLKDLFIGLGKGGTAFLLYYPQRLLQIIYPLALGRVPSVNELSNPHELNAIDCENIMKWLESQGAMKKGGRGTDKGEYYISRSFIARLIDVDANTVRGGPRWQSFLRQFTSVQVSDRNLARRCTSGRKTEYPSQRNFSDIEANDSGTSEKTLGKYFDDLKTIIALHRHLPDVCPDPSEYKPKQIRRLITSVSDMQKHTPWVPIKTALSYTTEALRWVHVYGEDLVTIFLQKYKELHNENLLVSAPEPDNINPSDSDYAVTHKIVSDAREILAKNTKIPTTLTSLRLNGWQSYQHLDGDSAFKKLREAPSLLDAIMILVGAIVVVIGITKPIRESELRAIKRDCLLFFDGDGYWLSHDVRKRNVGDVRPIDARPIPTIVAKAIQLLRRLTDGLKEIIGVKDEWLLESLFTIPSFGRYEASIESVMSAAQLNYTLDAFCDYVALPIDDAGRRWYLRIHEMRKSFLIVFFWTFRFATLDAARWMAGHANSEHLYAYIQANFPGEELPSLEAEYASQVLRDYQSQGRAGDVSNVEILHREVCQHFCVSDVSCIDESTLKDWLELQFETGEYEICPYSLTNIENSTNTVIAFRIRSAERVGNTNG